MRIENWERELAIKLANILVENGIEEHLSQYDVEDWYDDRELVNHNIWMSAGATKSCAGIEGLDGWIVKIGHSSGVSKDYARVEYDNYVMAEEAGLAHYFPYTDFLCECNGLEFYIQEFAQCDEDEITSEWHQRLSDIHEENGENIEDDWIWDEVYSLEDEEKISLMYNNPELLDFLQEHRINDLHEGNFGFINDRIVIIDFSGYAR